MSTSDKLSLKVLFSFSSIKLLESTSTAASVFNELSWVTLSSLFSSILTCFSSISSFFFWAFAANALLSINISATGGVSPKLSA